MIHPLPRHVLPDSALVGPDGRLSVGGVDVLELAEGISVTVADPR